MDEGSARRRDLYLVTRKIHKRRTSILPARFEPAITVNEQPQTYVLDSAATGIGYCKGDEDVTFSVVLY